LAHKGTLFLDEIGHISPLVQTKLVRLLKEAKIERRGGREPIEVDVRVVCGTQQDLECAVREGRFQIDLYHLLQPRTISLPPLRDRREDVLMIAEHLLRQAAERKGKAFKGLSDGAQALLLRYSFPGNIRELEDMIERAVALARHTEEVQGWDLCGFASCPLLGGTPQEGCRFCREGIGRTRQAGPAESLAAARDQFERQYISAVLERVQGNRDEAAKILGVTRKALAEKCRGLNLSDRDETQAERPPR
jgi:DNA-binding NtrC family response regulator